MLQQTQYQVAEIVGRVYRPVDSLADLLAGLLSAAVREISANQGTICIPGLGEIRADEDGQDAVVHEMRNGSPPVLAAFTRNVPMPLPNPAAVEPLPHSADRPMRCRASIVYQKKEIGCVSFAFERRLDAHNRATDFLQSFAREIAFLLKRYEVTLYTGRELGTGAALIGSSRALRRLEETIEKVAETDLPVLIEAEFGSGDQAAAAAIHLCSSRKDQPFVTVHCPSQRPITMWGELVAALEQARGGTLFLRSLDELDHTMQKELLRFLRSFRPSLASTGEADLRILASATRPMEHLVREGRVCRFLRTEIDVLKVEVPPLRDRREDIKALLEYELRKHDLTAPKRFSATAVTMLENHDWPENLLELQRAVARLTIMTDGDEIDAADLRQHLGWDCMMPESEPQSTGDAPDPDPPMPDAGVELNENFCPPEQHLVDLARKLIAGDFETLEKYGPGIERALIYVAGHFDHEISLAELARQSHFSPSHLCFLFKKILGISFKGILTVVRIEKARQLLAEKPNHSITEISLDVGFGDLSHFEKTFKRMTGLNPREFRRRRVAEMAVPGKRTRPSMEQERLA